MKRILVISTSFPDVALAKGQEAAGGFVYDFVQSLSHYAQVSVVAPAMQDSTIEDGRLTLHRFAIPFLPLSQLSPTNLKHLPVILKTLWLGHRAVMHITRTSPFDHILALWALPCGYWAQKAAAELNIPYSTWALGSDIWALAKIPLVKKVLRSVLTGSAHRFADGFVLAEDVQKIAGRDCHFLPSSRNMLPGEDKVLASRPPYKLAFLGRWHTNKGIDLLLNGLMQIPPDSWNDIEEVRICGGGPLETEVKTAVDSLTTRGHPVSLQGYLDKTAASELLNWADYVLLPSRIESIPVVFSDAMQCLCPVISMPVGDLPRLLEEYQVGVCATDVSDTAFARAIDTTLKSPPERYQASLVKARQAFQIDSCVHTLLDTITRA